MDVLRLVFDNANSRPSHLQQTLSITILHIRGLISSLPHNHEDNIAKTHPGHKQYYQIGDSSFR